MREAAGSILPFLNARKRLRAWQDAAASCGLQVTEVSRGWRPRLLAGDGVGIVWIEPSGLTTRIVAEVPGPPELREVMIRPQTEVGELRDVKTGDWAFDGEFFVGGPVPLVFALFVAETRRRLSLAQAEGRIELSAGELQATVDDAKVPRVLPLLLDLRGRLAAPLDLAQRLVDNAGQDPEPEVRLQNLALLIHEDARHPKTVAALRKALSDPSPVIRLRAARELGPKEGRDVLLQIAESLERDALSAEAVSKLYHEIPFERLKALLDRSWVGGYPATALACLHRIGYSGHPGAVDALAGIVALENVELAVAAAEALGSTLEPAAERPLIQALDREAPALRLAAARALRHVGSTAAVLPLREAAAKAWREPALRDAANLVIAEIQSRIQGAAPGQLSLAGAEAGRLSLARDVGELSLADDPAGRLSLPPEERT